MMNLNFKKLVAVIASAAMMASLTACGVLPKQDNEIEVPDINIEDIEVLDLNELLEDDLLDEDEEDIEEDVDVEEEEEEDDAASSQFGTISKGTIDEDTYENEYFGIGATLSDEWEFKSEAEIAANNQVAVDMLPEEYEEAFENNTVMIDMMATNVNGVDVLQTTIEKLSIMSLTMSESDYLAAGMPMAVQGLKDMGIQDVETNESEIEFLGETHATVEITGTYMGYNVYQKQIVIKKGQYVFLIAACSWFDDKTDEMLENFYALED